MHKKEHTYVIVKSTKTINKKGVFLMSTLQQNALQFNSNCSISNDGGQLSSDSGLLLVQEFLHHIGFDALLQEHCVFFDPRKYCFHSSLDLFKQLLFQTIVGYKADSVSDSLCHDPVFTLALSKDALASQPTMSRFTQWWDASAFNGLQSLNRQLGNQFVQQMNCQEMVIDVDSTHSDTFGKQENTAYNGHYGTVGYHPLVAFDGLTGFFLGAQLRPGNVYTSNGVADFLRPIVKQFRGGTGDRQLLIRGDSGFATPEVYQLCEELRVGFDPAQIQREASTIG
ncbi:hypothetical protein RU98_GL000152 [Enterococcus caccae]|nr:hypothetical protein RU98_GL000152 [Enterococcus caccae]